MPVLTAQDQGGSEQGIMGLLTRPSQCNHPLPIVGVCNPDCWGTNDLDQNHDTRCGASEAVFLVALLVEGTQTDRETTIQRRKRGPNA